MKQRQETLEGEELTEHQEEVSPLCDIRSLCTFAGIF